MCEGELCADVLLCIRARDSVIVILGTIVRSADEYKSMIDKRDSQAREMDAQCRQTLVCV